MSDKIQTIQRIVAKDGSYIQLPPWYSGEENWANLAHPNVYVADSKVEYPRGTKYVEGERVFRYAIYDGKLTASTWNSIADTAGDDLMGKALFNTGFAQDYASSLVYGAGSTVDVWTTVASTVVGTERSNDFYSGGWMNGKDTAPSDARMFFRRITKSVYSAAKTVNGTARTLVTTLTLDQALVNSFTAMTFVLTPNPWKHAAWFSGDANAGYSPVLGVSMVNNPTANYNVWLQTWGECGTAQITNAAVGASERETSFYIMSDGSFQGLADGTTDTYGLRGAYTYAGYTLVSTVTESGSGQDESYPILFLRLSP